MSKVLALICVALSLSGCAAIEQARRERQAFIAQCNAQGNVVYKNYCMTPQQAQMAQQRDWLADQAERNRRAQVEAACASAGGYMLYGSCNVPNRDVNVNVRRY